MSSDVKKKTIKINNRAQQEEDHDTKVTDVGSARRNITRKKSGDGNFDCKNKKQGGSG